MPATMPDDFQRNMAKLAVYNGLYEAWEQLFRRQPVEYSPLLMQVSENVVDQLIIAEKYSGGETCKSS